MPDHLVDREQREQIAQLGIWLFLGTEALFFGGLFLGYAVYRGSYPDAFVAASGHLNAWLGITNTAILLTSSLFAALAVLAARRDDRRAAGRHFLITVVLALGFLGSKAYEYYSEAREGLVPGSGFALSDPHEQLFFCFYFLMTGLHAIHMIAGVSIIFWLVRRLKKHLGKLTQTETIRRPLLTFRRCDLGLPPPPPLLSGLEP